MVRYGIYTKGIDGKITIKYIDAESFRDALGMIMEELLIAVDYGSTIKVVQPEGEGRILAHFTFKLGRRIVTQWMEFASYPD